MENVEPLRPKQPRRPAGTGGRRWRIWLAFLAIPLVLVVLSLARLWVDLMWFDEVGQQAVLTTRLKWSLAMGIFVGLFAFAVLHVNLVIARRVARNDLYVPFLANANPEAPEQPVVPHFVMRPILLGVALVIALLAGLVLASSWETVLRFHGRSDFGITDPQFHRDISFYVFTMPLLELVVRTLQTLVVVTGLVVGIAYTAMGVIRYTPAPRIARAAVTHLASLVAAFFVIEAFSYRLDIWNLVNSHTGAATGAGFTDVHARIPGYWVVLVASLVIAAFIVVVARRNRLRLVGYGIVGWLAIVIVTTALIPAIVQSAIVKPDELNREGKVLKNNIEFTRLGFGLDTVQSKAFTDRANLTPESIAANEATTSNIRLWSPDVLKKVLEQAQALRTYYDFNDVDVDRYTINGNYRQVMLAVREIDPSLLGSPTWVNERLQYTHGYGVVGVWPNETATQGRPEFFLRGISSEPNGQDDIKVTRPEIYFGEKGRGPVVVNSRQKEFDYPADDGDQTTSYKGDGGIRIKTLFHKLAMATTFGDPRLLFSGAVTGESRLIYRRNVQERISTLAPFLTLDADPYPVLVDGRVLWVQDAYTTTNRFPFSQATDLVDAGEIANAPEGAVVRGREVNYLRNSVKAVIDAYSGKVTMYAVDEKDPVLKAWRNIFPSLFTDVSEMPEEIEAHLRYPEDLFNVQTDMWRRYHMSNVDSFYSNEDLWESATVGDVPLEPFYVLAKLPGGEDKEELLLVRPLVPRGKKNLIAYMAARMDPGHYGEIMTLTLPKGSATQGPTQVSSLIRQDTEISRQLREWQQGDTRPLFGNLLVLPIGNSLLYAQPVYLESQEAKLPEFRKVVLVMGDTIAWGSTFEEASRNLFERRAAERGGASEDEADATTDSDADDGESTSPPASENVDSSDARAVLAEVSRHYDAAIECQRQGDWECYGRETKAVQQLLEDAGLGDE